MAKNEVIECCPHCEREVVMQWDTEADGYEAICPYCGNRLMLCDECQHSVCEDGEPHDCDWCANTKVCHRCKTEIARKERQLKEDFERQLLRKKAHECYKMHWMITHGITIDHISRAVSEYVAEFGGGAEDCIPFKNHLEENGFFGGSVWPCFGEFVECEYQDASLMRKILDADDFIRYIKMEKAKIPDIQGNVIEVETPRGKIVAKDQNDADYPGISLFFVPEGTDVEHAGCVMEYNPTYHPIECEDRAVPSVNLRIYEREDPFNDPQQVLVMEPLSLTDLNTSDYNRSVEKLGEDPGLISPNVFAKTEVL